MLRNLIPRTAVALLLVPLAGCQPFQSVQVAAPPVLFDAPPMVGVPVAVGSPVAATTIMGPVHGTTGAMPGPTGQNPLYMPVTNAEWAWEQIADVVDDYFRIERERQVQLVGQVLTEGRIDTFSQVGATIVEPHRRDSVGRANRWESTFQTIRRRAVLRVIPEQGGYLIDVEVQKELEDLPRPEHATAGAATFRNDNSLQSRLGEQVSRTHLAGRWLSLGRDPALEQQILAEIRARLAGATGTVR